MAPGEHSEKQEDDEKNLSKDTSKNELSDLSTADEKNLLDKSTESKSDDSIVVINESEELQDAILETVSTKRNASELNGKDNELDNNNRRDELNSSPLLTIASVASLSTYAMDTPLFDENNIIISDDEEFTFDNAL